MTNQVLIAAAFLVACSPGDTERQEPPRSAVPASLPDSQVLTLPDGGTIWFTSAMVDTAVTGETCRLRTLEIRRDASRIPVPLLYTMGPLELVNDSTVSATLVRDCAGHDTYLVNTRTGQPRRAK